MLETRRIILGAIQTARGTATALTTTSHFLEASGIAHPQMDFIDVKDESFTPLDTPLQSDHVDEIWDLGENVFPLRLGSAAGDALPIGWMLQACGLTQTLAVSTSATYAWLSQAPASRKVASADAYVDGEVFKLKDVVGNGVLRGKVGEQAEFAFAGKGIANGAVPSAATFPSSATASSTQGRLIVSAATAVTQDGTAIAVKEFEIDFGCEVSEFYDTDSGRGSEIAGWAPKLTITKLASAASADWAALRNATGISFVITLGTGRTLVITMPNAVPESTGRNADNKRLFDKIECSLHDSAGDDAITAVSL